MSYKSEKRVTKIKIEPLKSIYYAGNPVIDQRWLNHWKWLVPGPMLSSWIFCQTGSIWIVFLDLTFCPTPWNCWDMTNVSKNEPVGSILTFPKSVKLLSILKCSKLAKWPVWKSISSHGKARNIKFGQQVNLIQRVPLGTPPQEVATSLPYNHVTEELLLSHLGSKNSSLKEIHMTLLHLEVVTSLPLITRRLKSSSASCFKYFVIVKFSKFCRKDKCFRGSWAACRLLYLYMKQGN